VNAEIINKRLDKLDDWLADPENGLQLYQILSGSLRGPDNGAAKNNTTMRLRRICFPKTCKQGNTGMMSTDGVPSFVGTTGALDHFVGHVNQAISYLQQAGRGVFAKGKEKAA
jgi:hypothetical protein